VGGFNLSKEYIKKDVEKLIKRCGSRDPFEICASIGLNVRFADLGNLKGMYKYYKRNRYALINSELDENMQKIVCAHELGHDRLHQHFAKDHCLQEFMLYDMRSRPEYEANLFASELLIADDDILEFVNEGCDIEQTARSLNTDVNLVAIKLASMNTRGFGFIISTTHKSDFLGK